MHLEFERGNGSTVEIDHANTFDPNNLFDQFAFEDELFDDYERENVALKRKKRFFTEIIAGIGTAVAGATAAISGVVGTVGAAAASAGAVVEGVVGTVGAAGAAIEGAVGGVSTAVGGAIETAKASEVVKTGSKVGKFFKGIGDGVKGIFGGKGKEKEKAKASPQLVLTEAQKQDIAKMKAETAAERAKNQVAREEVHETLDTVKQNQEMIEENGRKLDHNLERINANGEAIARNGRGIEANHEAIEDNSRKLDRNLEDILQNRREVQQNREEIQKNGHAIDRNFEGIQQNWQSLERNFNQLKENSEGIKQNYWATKQNGLGILITAVMIHKNKKASDRNFEEIKKFEYNANQQFEVSLEHYDKIESTLDQALSSIEASKVAIIDRIELAQAEILESIKKGRTEPIVSALKTFFNFFINEAKQINALPVNLRIPKLEQSNDFLEQLKNSRTPLPGTLFSHLSDVINQQFAIPTGPDDKIALSMLELLCYGMQVYILIVTFMLQQYSLLAENYYYQSDLDQFNNYYRLSLDNLKGFTDTLVGSDGFLEKVSNVLDQVTSLSFIRNTRQDIVAYAASAHTTFDAIRDVLEKLKDGFNANVPNRLSTRLDFSGSNVETPRGKWTSGKKVYYAIQLVDSGTRVPSMVSDWSAGYTVDDAANPVVTLPADDSGLTRIVFRKFDSEKPELVAVIVDDEVQQFTDMNRELFNAVSEQNQKLAKRDVAFYLEKGADVNAQFEHRKGAMHVAAEMDNWDVAKLLIRNSTNINLQDEQGHAPVYIAAESGFDSLVRNLVESGADLAVRTSDAFLGLTPLHGAAMKGHSDIVAYLMAQSSVDVNGLSASGFTALHFAASFCQDKIVAKLIGDSRVESDVQSKDLFTPLHLASINNCHQVVETLLGLDSVNVMAKASNNMSALHYATVYGSDEVVDLLINKQPKLLVQKTTTGFTVAHYAALNGDEAIVERVTVGDVIDAQNDADITPLYIAFQYSHANAAAKLVELGANLNVRVSGHRSMVHLAAANADIYTVFNLISSLDWVHLYDAYDREPLYYAVKSGVLEIAQQLLKSGANPDAVDMYGTPVVHLIVYLDESTALEMLKLLTAYDVNLNVVNGLHATLFHLVCQTGYYSVAKFLLERGVDVNEVKENWETPLHLAALGGHLELVKLLVGREKGANLNAQTIYGRNSPLHYTVLGAGSLDMITYLHGREELNMELANADGYTAAMLAVKSAKFDIATFLVNQGADYLTPNQNGVSMFLLACEAGNLKYINYLGDKVNYAEKDVLGRNALYYAISGTAQLDVIEHLVSSGVSIEEREQTRRESLVLKAVQQAKYDIVEYLINDAGADFGEPNCYGDTPLHEAARQGNLEMVKLLVESCPDDQVVDHINQANVYGLGALFVAMEGQGNVELAKYLIDAGASTENEDQFFSRTLLDVVVAQNKTDIFEYMVNELNLVEGFDMNQDGATYLHIAARLNNRKLAEENIAAGKDINTEDYYGKTPLYYAIEGFGDVAMVELLVEAGAQLAYDPTKVDSPLFLAIALRKFDVAEYLFSLNGVDLKGAGKSGNTPLHAALEVQSTEWIKNLLDNDAYSREPNWAGLTPFDLLIEGHKDVAIKYLALEYRSASLGQSMLHFLAATGENAIVEYLLQRGAFVNALDHLGNTPLHLAVQKGLLQTVALLATWPCADLQVKNENGQTPLEAARYAHYDEIGNFLDQLLDKQNEGEDTEDGRRRRRRRQVEQSEQTVSSGAGKPSWWVIDVMGLVVSGLRGIADKFTIPSSFISAAPPPQSQFFSQVSSIDTNSSLLLLDVFIRKFSGQKYLDTTAQSVTPTAARAYSLAIVQQFERMLSHHATGKQIDELSNDWFELYRTVERYMISGQYDKIECLLYSQAQKPFPDEPRDKLVRMIDGLMIETQKQHFEHDKMDQSHFSDIVSKTLPKQVNLIEANRNQYLN